MLRRFEVVFGFGGGATMADHTKIEAAHSSNQFVKNPIGGFSACVFEFAVAWIDDLLLG